MRFASLLLISVSGIALAASLTIVQDGRPRAAIVVAPEASQQVQEAAKLLSEYVKQSSGAELAVVTPDQAPAALVRLHVGPSQYVDGLGLKYQELDDDGFVLQGLDGQNFVIVGPTDYGTEFGVYEFLERYVGVRWLLPGEHGTDVPAHRTIAVPSDEVRQEPAFFSRLFSGLRGGVQGTWARRNRMHGRVSFHHNLINLLPPEKYTKTHPEFFPLRNGKRFLPATNHTHGWQPCFTAPGIVEEFVKNICEYFEQHPEATSCSLGVNDSSGHCECDNCQARDPGGNNFLGRRDVSDRYFEWANKVVEGVLQKYPDKVFGCLAYSEVAEPPKRVKVHPRIIPYMTYDRMKWIHPEVRAAGHAATEAWQKASPTLGWYDYIYGTPYCLPRVYFHEMAKYYRYGHRHGVRCLYAEAYPNFGEGPKLYVSLKLQWNPFQSEDELLAEWFHRCAGPGAQDLAAYYRIWEDFWTKRILDSPWFSVGGQYLSFGTPGYLALVTRQDITKSRALLESALAKAATPEQKARVGLLMRAFEYYEASALAYLGDQTAPTTVVRTEEQALQSLNQAEECLRMAEKRRHLALEVFPKDPVLVNPLGIDRYGALSGKNWGAGAMWRVFDWAAKPESKVRARVRELAQSSDSKAVRDAAQTMLLLLDSSVKPLSKNPSVEEGEGNTAPPWSFWVKWGTGSMKATAERAHTGKRSILCHGMKRGGPNQTLQVPPGRYAATAFVYIPEGQDSKGTAELSVTLRNAQGRNLPSPSTTICPPPGQWSIIATSADVPVKVGKDEVKSVMLIVVVNGFKPDEKIYLDDIALYRLGDLPDK